MYYVFCKLKETQSHITFSSSKCMPPRKAQRDFLNGFNW